MGWVTKSSLSREAPDISEARLTPKPDLLVAEILGNGILGRERAGVTLGCPAALSGAGSEHDPLQAGYLYSLLSIPASSRAAGRK